jgi:prophage antirepressor-like protein
MEINNMFTFTDQTKINVIGTKDTPYFYATQIGKLLGYVEPRKATAVHVWDCNKFTVGQYRKQYGDASIPSLYKDHTILLNEHGVYQLIFRSHLNIAKQFQKWVFDIISDIRKSGCIQLPKHHQLTLMNESDLHKQVVSFIKNKYPQALINATLGEMINDNQNKRYNAYKLGYHAGCCDVMVYNPNHKYNGLCIEFKNPNGRRIVSDKQLDFQQKIKMLKWFVICSDSYDDILVGIINYFMTVRIPCKYCMCKFKTHSAYANHCKYFHKITNDIV